MLSLPSSLATRSTNRRSCVVTAEPAEEPASVADLKLYLRIDPSNTADDTMLTRQIKAAREAVETYLNRSLVTQTRKLTLDAFPGGSWNASDQAGGEGYDQGPSRPLSNGVPGINLPWGPIQSISSVKYYDQANVLQTVASSTYFLDASSGRMVLNDGASWPVSVRSRAAVEITFVAGYGAAAAVPGTIVEAILQVAAKLYECRGNCSQDDALAAVTGMLARFRVPVSYGRTW